MKMKDILYLALIQALSISQNYGQTPAYPRFPEIKITISKNQFRSLLEGDGQKMDLMKPVLIINRDTAKVKGVHSRGNNSLRFEHKSLSVDLGKSITLRLSGEKVKIKRFD